MLDLSNKLTFEHQFSEVSAAARFDAQYFQPKYQTLIQRLKEIGPVEAIGGWGKVLKGQSVGEYIDDGVPVIRSGDLVDLESLGDVKYADSSEDLFYLQPGDVLISSIGLGSIGKVQVFDKPTPYATVSEVTVIRQSRVDPYYLQTFLRSVAGQLQIEQRITGATGQLHLYPRDVGTILVPILSPSKQQEVRITLDEALERKRASQKLYIDAEALLLKALDLDGHLSTEIIRDTAPILDRGGISDNLTYEGTFKAVITARRFDAQYFAPKYQRAMAIMGRSGQTIHDVASLTKCYFKPVSGETFRYIEIGDLTAEGHAEVNQVAGEHAPSRAQWIVEPGDIITSTVRPIRRLTALVELEQAGAVCSSGFAVLRSKGVEPEVLLVYLRSPIVSEILDLHTTATMYPAIAVGDLLRVPITLPELETRSRIVAKVQEARAARQEANRLLDEAKQRVESLILGVA